MYSFSRTFGGVTSVVWQKGVKSVWMRFVHWLLRELRGEGWTSQRCSWPPVLNVGNLHKHLYVELIGRGLSWRDRNTRQDILLNSAKLPIGQVNKSRALADEVYIKHVLDSVPPRHIYASFTSNSRLPPVANWDSAESASIISRWECTSLDDRSTAPQLPFSLPRHSEGPNLRSR